MDLKEEGYSGAVISKIVDASKLQINDIYKKYQKAGGVVDLQRTGRPKRVTEERNGLRDGECPTRPISCIMDIITSPTRNFS